MCDVRAHAFLSRSDGYLQTHPAINFFSCVNTNRNTTPSLEGGQLLTTSKKDSQHKPVHIVHLSLIHFERISENFSSFPVLSEP